MLSQITQKKIKSKLYDIYQTTSSKNYINSYYEEISQLIKRFNKRIDQRK